jgi:hypothetical protein
LSYKTSDIGDLLRSFADDKDFDVIKLANAVEKVRQELALLDANLEDCYSILSGYAKYEAQRLSAAKQKKQEKQEDESTGGN